MAEKGEERPLDKYYRFRKNPQLWQNEMNLYKLSENQKQIISKYYADCCGVPAYQETLMEILMDKDISNFTLKEANAARKVVAKKKMNEIPLLKEKFFNSCKEKNLAEYVWHTAIQPQLGYSFSINHSLPYSFVGIQTIVISLIFPKIFWNTANLIIDSDGLTEEDIEKEEEEVEETYKGINQEEEEIVDIYEPEDWEDYEYEDLPDKSAKKKTKRTKSVNFGKIATAIGKFHAQGVKIMPPDINQSGITFTPILSENAIACGLRSITRISTELVNQIIENRPYDSIEDFREKVKVNKIQMLNLLKSGAFDCIYSNRLKTIRNFIESLVDIKSNLTLANVPMLDKYGLLSEQHDLVEEYMFNKFLRKHVNKTKDLIIFPEKALEYYCDHYDVDLLNEQGTIPLKTWDKIYKKSMEPLAKYIKDNKESLLKSLNDALIEEAIGKENFDSDKILSKYEMESISFYYHEHELEDVDEFKYGIVNFFDLPEDPIIDKVFPAKNGKDIKMYELFHIAGTVLNKDKVKNTVTLLTKYGVVTVKIWKNQFSKYDKQISEMGEDGKKHVKEKSWFTRGSLLYLQGIRRGDTFVPKAYKNSLHKIPIMKIIKVDGKDMYFSVLRYGEK